jgi:hypothetical protein
MNSDKDRERKKEKWMKEWNKKWGREEITQLIIIIIIIITTTTTTTTTTRQPSHSITLFWVCITFWVVTYHTAEQKELCFRIVLVGSGDRRLLLEPGTIRLIWWQYSCRENLICVLYSGHISISLSLHVVPRSKNVWSYISTPPIRLHGVVFSKKKPRDNFAFVLPVI